MFKDVIEPLESVSVSIIPTETKSLSDLGSPEKVRTVNRVKKEK